MVLVESSSGEYDTLAKLHELAATDSESEGEEVVEYGLVESSSSGDDGSYHSDNDEIAEYWDPYCKSISASRGGCLLVCLWRASSTSLLASHE